MMNEKDRIEALKLLKLACAFVAKGNEMGAYDGCVIRSDNVLRRLSAGIERLERAGADTSSLPEKP